MQEAREMNLTFKQKWTVQKLQLNDSKQVNTSVFPLLAIAFLRCGGSYKKDPLLSEELSLLMLSYCSCTG